MHGWEPASVTALGAAWPGACWVEVVLDRGDAVAALAYPQLVGEPRCGDRVVVNTQALDARLGTGGHAFVVSIEHRSGAPGAGRLVKARFTPQQLLVAEPADPGVDGLDGLPVVVMELHSALPAVLAGARASRPALRTVLVLDDVAALPVWYSRSVAGLRAAGWLAATVSAGQAFGGDVEAVNIYDALLTARGPLAADLVVVAPGPGTVGTATRWGFSGIAAGEALNAVGVLGGRAIGVVRLSEADLRPRHRLVSHHSLTAYGRVALVRAELPYPAGRDDVAAALGVLTRHRLVAVDSTGLLAAMRAAPVELSSMGRGLDDDPLAFLAAAVAGRHAADLMPL